MEKAIASDQLRDVIAGRKIKAAVFTTYGFEPEFFELDIVPLLLPGNIAYSL